eukprot:TRINITY_DN1727_c0_g2_i1.p1 TRINITY_DN1727_c0_g2~~TRINITY_DN1727_c0_g2_i1.p1  ORF type:complete len:334 (+),score=53.61 TRINITY_DN1727_c0_g2_i1:74-1003(+)
MQPSVANLRTTATTWWCNLPMATRAVLVVCTSMWFLNGIGLYHISGACSGGYTLLGKWQIWRLLTAPITHVGLLHLAMNMAALLSLLPPLEKAHGTAAAFTMLFLFMVLSQIIAITPCTVFHVLFGVDWVFEWRACSAGISGVLFSLLTLHVTTDESGLLPVKRVLCGFAIPNAAYPWVLIVLIQLLMPGVSFMGHVGGVLAAYLFPPATIRGPFVALDGRFPTILKSSSSYVPTNRSSLPTHEPAVVSGVWSWSSAAASSTVTSASQEKSFPGSGRVLRSESPASSLPHVTASPPVAVAVEEEAPKHE